MNPLITKAGLATVGMALCIGNALAQQQKTDFGKREFDTNCASCHGADAKGNGPMGELLRRAPPDLTQLAKKNGGVFPMTRLFDVIEGGSVPSHGTRDMPIWGREYRIQDAEYYLEARGNYDSAALVRAHILTLLEYINRLQVR
jgi:mono/diheme cytochrome c family protein